MRKPLDTGKQEKIARLDIEQGLAATEKEEGEALASAPLLDPAEASRYLGVGREVLYRLFEEGRIRGVREGGSLRFEQASLDEFRSRGGLT